MKIELDDAQLEVLDRALVAYCGSDRIFSEEEDMALCGLIDQVDALREPVLSARLAVETDLDRAARELRAKGVL